MSYINYREFGVPVTYSVLLIVGSSLRNAMGYAHIRLAQTDRGPHRAFAPHAVSIRHGAIGFLHTYTSAPLPYGICMDRRFTTVPGVE